MRASDLDVISTGEFNADRSVKNDTAPQLGQVEKPVDDTVGVLRNASAISQAAVARAKALALIG